MTANLVHVKKIENVQEMSGKCQKSKNSDYSQSSNLVHVKKIENIQEMSGKCQKNTGIAYFLP